MDSDDSVISGADVAIVERPLQMLRHRDCNTHRNRDRDPDGTVTAGLSDFKFRFVLVSESTAGRLRTLRLLGDDLKPRREQYSKVTQVAMVSKPYLTHDTLASFTFQAIMIAVAGTRTRQWQPGRWRRSN
jgi:hypothetical protein